MKGKEDIKIEEKKTEGMPGLLSGEVRVMENLMAIKGQLSTS